MCVLARDLKISVTEVDAERFMTGFAKSLEIGTEYVQPAYEDPAVWILKEAELPENVTPEDSRLKDPEARQRIARVFERGLDKPAGFVLPIQRWQSRAFGRGWRSERWRARRGHLFLIPGDSPVGFRLPLGTLPYVSPSNFPYVYPADPNVPVDDLPDFLEMDDKRQAVFEELRRIAQEERDTLPETTPGREQPVSALRGDEPSEALREQAVTPDGATVRTAIAVEPRDGKLCLFMPPVEQLEDYLELIAAAEATADALDLPLHIEGYTPPHDSRLNVIKVAPDPGVIEVNVHPASSWKDCVDITSTVYDEARQCRLGADKFMIDGKHTGTGGGNHVVVGGATPMDSPFLRRPDLLRSLILYMQRHPSLSYLFSGTFIGPTSQAP
ncbi:unnamed protein product, partial [Chrysoparadoxa australica]